jgi:hypothetical protein
VDQEDLGIIALVAPDEAKAAKLKQFVRKSVGSLNSTLVAMVQAASEQGKLLDLQSLSWEPGWSAFLQYLAHTYRQIGNHEAFASQVEQVLRGTLGFQTLRRTNREWADNLVKGVYNYAERLKGKPLKLVDSTGFSWESVSNTLVRIGEAKLQPDIWTSELFGGKNDDLRRAMGVLLEVPELREPLREVTGGLSADGNKLSRIISDWVRGVPLTEMASKYFDKNNTGLEDVAEVSDDAMTNCCRSIFGRLTQTASWGLSALQSLTLGDSLDTLSPEEQRSVRNLPARVYYGVNSDEAIALRMLGVPRSAAEPLVRALKVNKKDGIHAIRNKLKKADGSIWVQALGKKGASYRRAWSIIEGEA